MNGLTDNLESIAEQIRSNLSAKDAAREKVLPLCRDIIRHSSNAIRAVHRQEFDRAREILAAARNLLGETKEVVRNYDELGSSGYIRDAEKEFAEASITLNLITRKPLPCPSELGVDYAAYLNGMGESVGELRRYLLDGLRKGNLAHSEELLSAMDDIYNVLVTMDFPDSITGGLRRTTDMVRGVLERTRSDLTLMVRQQHLEDKLGRFEGRIP